MGRGASAQILSHVLRDRLGGPRRVTGKVVCTGLSALGCLHRVVCTGFLSGFGYFRLETREIPSFSSTHLYFYLS